MCLKGQLIQFSVLCMGWGGVGDVSEPSTSTDAKQGSKYVDGVLQSSPYHLCFIMAVTLALCHFPCPSQGAGYYYLHKALHRQRREYLKDQLLHSECDSH